MADISATEIQDCMTIARAFEKGANHAMTEASVFAVITPRLATMRAMGVTVKNLMADKKVSDKVGLDGDANNIGAQSVKAEKDKRDVGEMIRECIPCSARIVFKGKMDVLSLMDPKGLVNEIAGQVWGSLKSFFDQALGEINAILEMFKSGANSYIDLCAFKKFFTEFVCIPDLAKLLALLTAFLMKLALELNAIFSLVISLFAPLLLPFLTGIVDLLMQFILACIKPVECIIESIQRMLAKLDYNVLFANIGQLEVKIGPKKGPRTPAPADGKSTIFGLPTTPGAESVAPGRFQNGTVDRDSRAIEFNLSLPGIQSIQNQKQEKVSKAEAELKALQEASLTINVADQAAVDRNRKQTTEAKTKVNEARQERDLSAIGRTNQKITQVSQALKGSLVSLYQMCRRAVGEIEAYIRKLVDEITALINEFMGGSGVSAFTLLSDKLQIIQLIGLIMAIKNALTQDTKCEDEGEEAAAIFQELNKNSDFTIFAEEDGTIHIEQKDEGIQEALEAFGLGKTGQNLKSLVQFTGDPVLDTSISRAVESLTTPIKVKFKCPLQTSVANAEQVNKWISELDSSAV